MRTTRWLARVCGLAVVLTSAGACGDDGGAHGTVYDAKRQIVGVPKGDEAMDRAISHARSTVRAFLPHLQSPPAGQSYLGVKVAVGEESAEHIWLYDTRYDAGQIVGRLRDDAEYVAGFHQGDEVRVRPEQVSDWMTIEDGHVCGGFTTRLIVAQLPPEEQARWFQGMGVQRLPQGDAVCDEGGHL